MVICKFESSVYSRCGRCPPPARVSAVSCAARWCRMCRPGSSRAISASCLREKQRHDTFRGTQCGMFVCLFICEINQFLEVTIKLRAISHEWCACVRACVRAYIYNIM